MLRADTFQDLKPKDYLLLFFVFVPPYLIDTIHWYFLHHYTAAYNAGICKIIPYLKISELILPQHFFSYVITQCEGSPSPQAIRIATYMVKLTLAIGMPILFFLPSFFSPLRRKFWESSPKNEATRKRISFLTKNNPLRKICSIAGMAIGIWLFCVLLNQYWRIPAEFYPVYGRIAKEPYGLLPSENREFLLIMMAAFFAVGTFSYVIAFIGLKIYGLPEEFTKSNDS